MNGQMRLSFRTRDKAVAYAQKHGIAFQVIEPKELRKIIKADADNVATNRRAPWTQ